MHTRLTVTAGTSSGIPARRAEIRVVFKESTGSRQHPKRTSPIIAGSIPARRTASFITTLPNLDKLKSFKVPPKAPIAVRQADTITTSFMMEKPP
jgi:hypothetical protein